MGGSRQPYKRGRAGTRKQRLIPTRVTDPLNRTLKTFVMMIIPLTISLRLFLSPSVAHPLKSGTALSLQSGTALPHQVVRLCRIKWYGSAASILAVFFSTITFRYLFPLCRFKKRQHNKMELLMIPMIFVRSRMVLIYSLNRLFHI